MSIHSLTTHLKKILKEESKIQIPNEPPVLVHERKDLPTLGTKVPHLEKIDDKQSACKEKCVMSAKEVQQERVDEGLDDACEFLQPATMPEVNSDLVGVRLDVCCKYFLEEGGTVLRWCQGVVTLVSNGSNIIKPGKSKACFGVGEAVMFQWDPIENRKEDTHISSKRPLPSKWNPQQNHAEGCWRLHVKNKMQE